MTAWSMLQKEEYRIIDVGLGVVDARYDGYSNGYISTSILQITEIT